MKETPKISEGDASQEKELDLHSSETKEFKPNIASIIVEKIGDRELFKTTDKLEQEALEVSVKDIAELKGDEVFVSHDDKKDKEVVPSLLPEEIRFILSYHPDYYSPPHINRLLNEFKEEFLKLGSDDMVNVIQRLDQHHNGDRFMASIPDILLKDENGLLRKGLLSEVVINSLDPSAIRLFVFPHRATEEELDSIYLTQNRWSSERNPEIQRVIDVFEALKRTSRGTFCLRKLLGDVYEVNPLLFDADPEVVAKNVDDISTPRWFKLFLLKHEDPRVRLAAVRPLFEDLKKQDRNFTAQTIENNKYIFSVINGIIDNDPSNKIKTQTAMYIGEINLLAVETYRELGDAWKTQEEFMEQLFDYMLIILAQTGSEEVLRKILIEGFWKLRYNMDKSIKRILEKKGDRPIVQLLFLACQDNEMGNFTKDLFSPTSMADETLVHFKSYLGAIMKNPDCPQFIYDLFERVMAYEKSQNTKAE